MVADAKNKRKQTIILIKNNRNVEIRKFVEAAKVFVTITRLYIYREIFFETIFSHFHILIAAGQARLL